MDIAGSMADNLLMVLTIPISIIIFIVIFDKKLTP